MKARPLFGEEIQEEIEEEVKAKEPSLFDYMNMMFKQPAKFAELPNYTKAKNFFMMQRFFSIKHPLIADAFNNIKIDNGHAVQCWSNLLSKIYNTTPSWIFNTLKATKNSKKEKEAKSKLFSDEAVRMYCKKNMISPKQFQDMCNFCPEVVNEEVGDYEKLLNADFEKRKVK